MTEEEMDLEKQRRRDEKLGLKGKTYNVRDKIKELGGLWDPDSKMWLMPDLESILSLNAKPVGDHFEI